MSREPFQSRGGIEVAVMGKGLPSLAERMQNERYELPPENPETDAFVQTLPRLIPFDSSMRSELDGSLWIGFDRQSQRPEDKGQIKRVLRWSHAEDIDSGIRMLKNHIAMAYGKDGESRGHVLTVVQQSNKILNRMQQSGITESELADLKNESAEALARSKFFTTYSPVKSRAATKTIAAVDKDILGRINPPRTRFMISKIREDLVRELFYADRIRGKNARRGVELVREREYERLCLETFKAETDELLQDRIGSGEFDDRVQFYLRRIHWVLSPRAIRVSPYSPLAAEIRFGLYATGNDQEVALLAGYVGDEEAATIQDAHEDFDSPSISAFRKKEILEDMSGKVAQVLEQSNIRLITPKSQMPKVA